MDGRLQHQLEQALREVEASGSLDAWLQQHPEGEELRSYLEMATSLQAQPLPEPPQPALARHRQRLLSQVDSFNRSTVPGSPMALNQSLARAGVILGGLFLFLIGAMGASAALGGPNLAQHVPVAGAVLDALNITDHTPDQADSHIEGAGNGATSDHDGPPSSLPEKACKGIGNSAEAAENGRAHANERAFMGAGNAGIDCANFTPPGAAKKDNDTEAESHGQGQGRGQGQGGNNSNINQEGTDDEDDIDVDGDDEDGEEANSNSRGRSNSNNRGGNSSNRGGDQD